MPAGESPRDCKPKIDCPAYQPVAGSKRCQHYLDGGGCALATEFMCVQWLKANGHPVPEHHPTRTASPTQPGLFPDAKGESHVSRASAPQAAQEASRAPTSDGSHVPGANARQAAQEASRAPTSDGSHVPGANARLAVEETSRAPGGQMPKAPALRVLSGALTAPKSHASEARGMRRASRAPTAPESEAPPAPVPAGPRTPITPEEIASFKALGVELCLDLEDVGPVWLVPHYTGQARKEITPEHAATLRLLLDAFPGARIGAFERRASGGGEEHLA